MKKLLIYTLVIVAATACLSSCSCNREESEIADAAEEQNTQLYAALQDHDIARAELLADSMAINLLDDLTPDEAVTVLLAYLEVHNDAVKKDERERDLRTLRKFIDVYDIALSNNPTDFPAAVAKAREQNSNLDLQATYRTFKENIDKYSGGGFVEEESEIAVAQQAKNDSTATQTEEAQPAQQEVIPEEGGDAPEIVKPTEE